MLALWLSLGVIFGALAGISAFLITYREYELHKIERGRLIRHALSSAMFAFLFFLIGAVVLGIAISHAL